MTQYSKYFGIIALAAVITVIVCSFGVAYQSERWEYRLVTTCDEIFLVDTEKRLNSLGREGWEIISAVPFTCHERNEIVFTLKRRAVR
jgi:hypothetical protein